MRALAGVRKRYSLGGPWVLDGIELELGPGGLVRIVGGNGTGKSTLLRLIAGIGRPTRGRVTGRPVTGYVPERFPPGLPFTALDYLTHLGRVHGLTTAAARGGAAELLDELGAAGFARTPLRELSKGTAQKVAVAQALLPRPGLLVLDEAWSGLDAAARDLLDAHVDARLVAGGCVVFVDHDPGRLAGRPVTGLRLDDGRLAPDGGPGPVPDGGPTPDAVRPLGATTLVELSGLVDPAVLVDPAGLVAAGCGVPPEAVLGVDGDLLRLRVPADAVDDVLRRALAAGPRVHVHRVIPDDGPGELPPGEVVGVSVHDHAHTIARDHARSRHPTGVDPALGGIVEGILP